MNKDRAHDVLHIWNGNKAENCPVCNGTMTDEAEMINAAQAIAAEQYYPRINPALPYDAMLCDENGNPIKKDDDTIAQEQPAVPSDAPVKADEKSTDTQPPEQKSALLKMGETVGFATDVMSFSDDSKNVPSRIKIIPAGTFNTPKYGELEISVEQLQQMKDNFEKSVRAGSAQTGIPIDIEHGETSHRDAAAGWMKQLSVFDDGLYADVEWTALGKDLLEKGIYKFFSPEFVFEYLSNEQSEYYANVLTGGGIVNKPLFDHSLPPIMASEDGSGENLTKKIQPHMLFISNQSGAHVANSDQSDSQLTFSEKDQKPMDLQTILAKAKSERTSDEQLFVAANIDQLTDEQKVAEGFVVAASETKTEEAPATPAPTPEDAAPAKGEQTIAAAEKANGMTISASEYETLKAAAEKGKLAFAELRKAEITNDVKALQFSENGGRIAPAQVEPIVTLMMTMNEPQQAQFKAILQSLPERKVFGEVGSDEDLDKSKAADLFKIKLNEEVNKLRQASPTMSMAEATKKASLIVASEHRDLYEASLQASVER
jgi:hypothetical protein